MRFLRALANPRFYPIWLALLVLAAIWMRLPYLDRVGFDDQFFRAWGAKLSDVGLLHVYLPPNTPNYPPLYLALLTPITWLSVHVLGASPDTSQVFITLQKSLNVLVDCADGLLLFALLRQRFPFWGSYALAALFLLNPYIAYDSAVWGQVDGLLSLFMLLSLFALSKKRPEWACVAAALGLLAKAQFVVFLPLLGLFILSVYGWKRAIVCAVWAAAVLDLAILPFASTNSLDPLVTQAYSGSSGYYPYLSLNAHNLWWLHVDPNDLFTNASDAAPFAYGLSAHTIGLILFGVSYLIPIRFLLRGRKPKIEDLALAAALAYLAFYCLNTEMHERYLYPFFALWLAGYRSSWTWWLPFVTLSVTQLLSLMMMISFQPSSFWARTALYPWATYPMTYANLACLALVLVDQLSEPSIERHQRRLATAKV